MRAAPLLPESRTFLSQIMQTLQVRPPPCCDWEPNFRHVENVKVELKAHLWLLIFMPFFLQHRAAPWLALLPHTEGPELDSAFLCGVCVLPACVGSLQVPSSDWCQHATDMLAYFPMYSRISISFLRRKSCLFIVLITWLFNLTAGTKHGHGQSERAIFSCAAARTVSRAEQLVVSYLWLWNTTDLLWSLSARDEVSIAFCHECKRIYAHTSTLTWSKHVPALPCHIMEKDMKLI